MSGLTERQLADVLKRGVPEPDDAVDHARLAVERATATRRRRWMSTTAVAALAILAAVTWPTVLGNGADDRTGPGPAAPTSQSECDPDCRPATVLAAIRKPLRIPVLQNGEACPVSPAKRFPAGAGFSSKFDAITSGTLAMAGSPDGRVPLQDGWKPRRWNEQKVIWVFDPSYPGPLLLRGKRIDARGGLRFAHYIGAQGYVGGSGDQLPHRRLFYLRSGLSDAEGGTLESYPSGVYVHGPGCYAVQADGLGFSERLVFEVVRR